MEQEIAKSAENTGRYLGHVSSSYHSQTLTIVAMAMIKSGSKLMGSKLFVSSSYGAKNIPADWQPVLLIRKQKANIIMQLLSSRGVDISQRNFQQVIIRGDGKDRFNPIINQEYLCAILLKSSNLERPIYVCKKLV